MALSSILLLLSFVALNIGLSDGVKCWDCNSDDKNCGVGVPESNSNLIKDCSKMPGSEKATWCMERTIEVPVTNLTTTNVTDDGTTGNGTTTNVTGTTGNGTTTNVTGTTGNGTTTNVTGSTGNGTKTNLTDVGTGGNGTNTNVTESETTRVRKVVFLVAVPVTKMVVRSCTPNKGPVDEDVSPFWIDKFPVICGDSFDEVEVNREDTTCVCKGDYCNVVIQQRPTLNATMTPAEMKDQETASVRKGETSSRAIDRRATTFAVIACVASLGILAIN